MGETTLLERLEQVLFKLKGEMEERNRLKTKLTNEADCMVPFLWKLEGIIDDEKKKNKGEIK